MSGGFRLWVVVDPDRYHPMAQTLSGTRVEALKAWCDLWSPPAMQRWTYWYRRGYRCMKCTIHTEAAP